MAEETETTLERRLELLERQTAQRKQRRKRVFFSVVSALLIVALAAGAWMYYEQNSSFAHQLKSLDAGYTLYAPSSSNTGGYTVDRSSLRNSSGFVIYTLRNGQRSITVTQQAIPSNPPDLTTFKGFDKLGLTAIGDGVVGQTEGRTISVIVTDSTVINITGSTGVTQSTVSVVASSLRADD